MPLVYRLANNLHNRLPREVELDDLIQAGVFGLMDAIKAFDPLRGIKFTTFAGRRLSGSMNDFLRDTDWVPRLVRRRSRIVSKAVDAARNALGHEPSREEIAEELGLCKSEVEKLIGDGFVATKESLSSPVFQGQDTSVKVGQLIADAKAADPFDLAAEEDWWERIVRGLTRAEQTVILLYHRDGMTMKEIGVVLGMSESRVSQMHSQLLQILRTKLTPPSN